MVIITVDEATDLHHCYDAFMRLVAFRDLVAFRVLVAFVLGGSQLLQTSIFPFLVRPHFTCRKHGAARKAPASDS